MTRELREKRTGAAREAMRAIQGYNAIVDDKDRSAAVYARIYEDIQRAFADHSPAGNSCFNDEQKACIEDIALYISLTFDAQNREPKSEITSIWRHLKSLPPYERWGAICGIIGGAAVTAATVIGWIVAVVGYFHASPPNTSTSAARASTTIEQRH